MSSAQRTGVGGLDAEEAGSPAVPCQVQPEACSTPIAKQPARPIYHRMRSLELGTFQGAAGVEGSLSPLPPATPIDAQFRRSSVVGTPTATGFGDRSSGAGRSQLAARELLASVAGLGPEATKLLLRLPSGHKRTSAPAANKHDKAGGSLATAFALGLEASGAQSPADAARNITRDLSRNRTTGEDPPPSPERSSHTSHIRKAIAAVRLNAAVPTAGTPTRRRSLTGSSSNKWPSLDSPSGPLPPPPHSRTQDAVDSGEAQDSPRPSPRWPPPRAPTSSCSTPGAGPRGCASRRLSVSLKEAAQAVASGLHQDGSSSPSTQPAERTSAPNLKIVVDGDATGPNRPTGSLFSPAAREGNAVERSPAGSVARHSPMSQPLPLLAWNPNGRGHTCSESGAAAVSTGQLLLPTMAFQRCSSRASSQPGTAPETDVLFGRKRQMSDLDMELASWHPSCAVGGELRRTWNGCSSPGIRVSPSVPRAGVSSSSNCCVKAQAPSPGPEVAGLGKRAWNGDDAEAQQPLTPMALYMRMDSSEVQR